MKRNDVLIATMSAAATTAIFLTMFWPAALTAKSVMAPKGVTPQIQTPKLLAEGCELMLTQVTDKNINEGKPFVRMIVNNPTEKPVTLSANVLCQTIPSSSPRSRMIPMPKKHWEEPCSVTIPARGTQQMDLNKPYPEGASFALTVGKKSVVMGKPKPMPLNGVQVSPKQIAQVQKQK